MSTKKYPLRQLITDPSSNELSMSRLLIGVLILLIFPAMLVLEAMGIKLGFWAQFALIVGSIAGIYFANSTARVWKEGGQAPRAKPAPPEGE